MNFQQLPGSSRDDQQIAKPIASAIVLVSTVETRRALRESRVDIQGTLSWVSGLVKAA
jgi:hypothetical protein